MSRKSNTPKLTEQQDIFCQEYIVDLNATQAAIRAGYSPASANEQASRMLAKANIQDRVNKLAAARAARTQTTADRVLMELGKLGLSDVRKLFDDKGGLLPPNLWPDDIAVAVSSVEVEELFDGYGEDRTQIGYTKKVKLWDKTKALELIGKHLKLFTDKVEHDFRGQLQVEEITYEAEFTRLPDKPE